jgi:hypothetical protein
VYLCFCTVEARVEWAKKTRVKKFISPQLIYWAVKKGMECGSLIWDRSDKS